MAETNKQHDPHTTPEGWSKAQISQPKTILDWWGQALSMLMITQPESVILVKRHHSWMKENYSLWEERNSNTKQDGEFSLHSSLKF